MNKEFEIVKHSNIDFMTIVLVEMYNRNPHSHSDMEVGLILEGSVYINIDGNIILAKNGDVFLLNPYQLHSFANNGENNLILALQISRNAYASLSGSLSQKEFSRNFIPRGSEKSDRIAALMITLSSYYFNEPPSYEYRCIAYLNELLYLLFTTVPSHTVSEAQRSMNRDRMHRLNRILEYIHQHYSEKVTIADIAEMEHLSVPYISHYIKSMIGISYQEYLNNIRFEHAYQLLLKTDLNLLDICLETGISSTRYLNNMFIEQYGYSAKEFRKKRPGMQVRQDGLSVGNLEHKMADPLAKKVLGEKANEYADKIKQILPHARPEML